jgi:CBS domain-containing protein
MRRAGVDQLPVVDDGGRPVGMLDIQDLLHSRVIE